LELSHSDNPVIAALDQWERRTPDQLAYAFLPDGERVGPRLTYEELATRVRAHAAALQHLVPADARVLLLYPSGLDFVVGFLGCLFAGVLAVPVPVPNDVRGVERILAVASDAEAAAVFTTSAVLEQTASWSSTLEQMVQLPVFAADRLGPATGNGAGRSPSGRKSASGAAYLQYTSGSTASPKGVVVTHENLAAQAAVIGELWDLRQDGAVVSWLPAFHDMGLVLGILEPLFKGARCYLMPPAAFIRRPARWLEALSRLRATHTGAPNFAFELCVRRTAAQERRQLDLSSVRMVANGAEPIRAKTLDRFAEAFGPYGLDRRALCPGYGLAEGTLVVTATRVGEEFRSLDLSKSALQRHQVVAAAGTDSDRTVAVSCGPPAGGMEIVIADPVSRRPLDRDRVGEIWVAGPSVASGYWRRPDETEETFAARTADGGPRRFLRTGDLGFLRDGELYVTGRLKDMLIVRGRNYYPQDIEHTVERSHEALRPGCGAAFAVDVEGEERVVVAHEVDHRRLGDGGLDGVVATVRQAIADEHNVPVHEVVLLRKGSIPKTSSGKIRRQACRDAYLDGTLTEAHALPRESDREHLPDPDPADLLVRWLRDYASDRFSSRLADERRSLPPHVVLDLGNRGILGMVVSEADGGLGLDQRAFLRVIEQLGAIDLTLATFVAVNNALGIRPIVLHGTPARRAALLPELAKGRVLASFAMTEPGAGSALHAVAARAVPAGDEGWALRGTKFWSGSAAWAGVVNVFVQLADADRAAPGLTGFTVEQGAPGVRMGAEALTMGMRGMVQNTVHLEDVRVGPADLLGELGNGMAVANDTLMFARLVIAALSLGALERAVQLLHRYASRRQIGTGRLLANPVTRIRLTEMTAAAAAIGALVRCAATRLDAGTEVPEEVYLACKVAGPELLWEGVDHLVQGLGGRGYIETNGAAQLMRDARVLRIFEGPTETLAMHLGSRLVHRGDGLRRLLDELGAQDVAAQLADATERVSSRCARLDDPVDRSRLAQFRLGWLATSALLVASLRWRTTHEPQAVPEHASVWAEERFRRELNAIATERGEQTLGLSPTELDDQAAALAERIGDVEQSAAWTDERLDPLLARAWTPPDSDEEPEPPVAVVDTLVRSEGEGAYALEDWLRRWIAQQTGADVAAISGTARFVEYGLDSVGIMNLLSDLEDLLDIRLANDIAWQHPTVERLAAAVLADAPETSWPLAGQTFAPAAGK
jgi:acyl-CoA synthetase (AMP-forming)/AMP-acid ligase II/alkylation response protein AidB-like acyl-CoA dehydrogenase/acyl carrier protein